jgi:hypothetical protein
LLLDLLHDLGVDRGTRAEVKVDVFNQTIHLRIVSLYN